MASTQYGTTWWGQRGLNALSGINFANRIPRGKTYANTGKVFKLMVDTECGVVKARVKGNYAPFYSVKIEFPEIPKAQQDKLISLIADVKRYVLFKQRLFHLAYHKSGNALVGIEGEGLEHYYLVNTA